VTTSVRKEPVSTSAHGALRASSSLIDAQYLRARRGEDGRPAAGGRCDCNPQGACVTRASSFGAVSVGSAGNGYSRRSADVAQLVEHFTRN
jgi:hypothetical protein